MKKVIALCLLLAACASQPPVNPRFAQGGVTGIGKGTVIQGAEVNGKRNVEVKIEGAKVN